MKRVSANKKTREQFAQKLEVLVASYAGHVPYSELTVVLAQQIQDVGINAAENKRNPVVVWTLKNTRPSKSKRKLKARAAAVGSPELFEDSDLQ